jgi:hypothetical protein
VFIIEVGIHKARDSARSTNEVEGDLMTSRRFFVSLSCALICVGIASHAVAQSPSVLYTWDNTGNASPNIENWVKNFGTNTAILDNAIPGTLRLIETGGAGADIAFSDGANRIRESLLNGSGGTDVTGLDYMEFDLGHTGGAPIPVQFYVQASTGFDFVALGPDLMVTPGMNTYQVPLTSLTPAQAVYLRTMGFNARDHAAVGDVVWSLQEVRTGGTPLIQRDLITHNTGTAEGGLQGVYANFDLTAIQGNNGGQNQTGFSHNPAGSGSLQWTDLGGQQGAAVSWGNGTALNGNTFNNREADLSNYERVLVRISATDPNNGGGTLGMNSFIQANNFAFQSIDGGSAQNIPIDGQFHNVTWSLAGMNNMNGVDNFGLNLFGHAQDLVINVDLIRFTVPEPASICLVGIAALGCLGLVRRRARGLV